MANLLSIQLGTQEPISIDLDTISAITVNTTQVDPIEVGLSAQQTILIQLDFIPESGIPSLVFPYTFPFELA